ncbi:hypothetical protein BGZ65_000915 [Modicella reniformis]|uniref:Uncharacterized protein n=1 Tax=Modicella reniformis TaxID=1440133 RepID=A0A9P6MJV0_9FUNG|nr:hypothetical protein BGZ65_000915 [Modicella reniformis]
MEHRDALNTTPDHSDDITPETIDHLLNLAHLRKPDDPQELLRLERDVRRMRNFLNYIRSTDNKDHASASIESLRSLVDDGKGVQLRSCAQTASGFDIGSLHISGDQDHAKDDQQELVLRRDVLLQRPKQVKGNFFVVTTTLDPKEDS